MTSLKTVGNAQDARPVLHLDGPLLARSLESLVKSAEKIGGVETVVEAVQRKVVLFQELLGGGKLATLHREDFEQLCAFMATCRRRIAAPLKDLGYEHFRSRIEALLDGAEDTMTADARLQAFVRSFPEDKSFRWVRDMGAEILHCMLPEKYPIMCKWVWDNRTNTGLLREIWHGDNVDHMVIDVPDTYETFVVLREELSQFLADNGVYRDMLFCVDVLEGQIYADYINSQGGTYLRADFSSEADPMEHTKRILGLDGISARTGRSRFKTIDGEASPVHETKLLS